ncbi:hypothetical protein FOL47_005398 [Perkinsus chesapeaki]|uniref:Uncharacterized protein n=1 Tax=Perkinsus chesapeaki TaxID=330153 RepID=A0A7J6N2J9_PERCH|nr:hypothetical protein FOL47_005398 [Perkinsus chesapeaki]
MSSTTGQGGFPLLLTAGGKSLEPVSQAALSKAARMLGQDAVAVPPVKAANKRPTRESLLTFEAPLLRPHAPLEATGVALKSDETEDTTLGMIDHQHIEMLPRPLCKKRKADFFEQLQHEEATKGSSCGVDPDEVTASDLDALEASLPFGPDQLQEFIITRRFPLLYVGVDSAGLNAPGVCSTAAEDLIANDGIVSVRVQARAVVETRDTAGAQARGGLLVVDQDQLPGSRREFGLPTGPELCWRALAPGQRFHRSGDAEAPVVLPGGWKFPSRLLKVDREWVDMRGRVASCVLGDGLWIGFEKGDSVLVSGEKGQLSRLLERVQSGAVVEVRNCWALPDWLVTSGSRELRGDSTSVEILRITEKSAMSPKCLA